MNRAKRLLTSGRLIRWFHTPSLLSQASKYHHSTPLLPFSSSFTKCTTSSVITQHNLHFSTEPNEWSEGLEKNLLEKFQSTPVTHETVVHVLDKLKRTPKKAFAFFNWVSDKHGFNPSLLVYTQMLRILSNEQTLQEFWCLAKRMSESEEGLYVDIRTYGTVFGNFKRYQMAQEVTSWEKYYTKMTEEGGKDATVNGVVGVVLGSDWGDEVEKNLEAFKGTLSENAILRIIWDLSKYPLKAYSFFRWLGDPVGYTHNAVTYNCLVVNLAHKESIKEFWVVIKEMTSLGIDLDIDSYTKISRRFGAGMMMEDKVELYELIMDSPFKPCIENCAGLLIELSRAHTPDISLVFRVVKKYEAAGNALFKGVYDVMYNCLIGAGKLDEAEHILDTMRNAGFEPDKVTYSQGFFALVKNGKLEEAIEMLNDMEAKGYFPDLTIWTNVIRVLCSVGEIDQALKFYTILSEKNLEVDSVFLDSLVNGLCSKNRLDSAYTLVTELVSKADIRPFRCTYQILIRNLVEGGKFEEGMSLLLLMKKHKYPLLRHPFVNYISKSGTVANAKELLEALSVRKYANVLSYQHVLQSFLKEGRQAEARDLFDDCPHHIRNYESISNLFASPKLGNAAS